MAGYAAAFQYLLHILTLITLASAAVVLGLLSKNRTVSEEGASDAA